MSIPKAILNGATAGHGANSGTFDTVGQRPRQGMRNFEMRVTFANLYITSRKNSVV